MGYQRELTYAGSTQDIAWLIERLRANGAHHFDIYLDHSSGRIVRCTVSYQESNNDE